MTASRVPGRGRLLASLRALLGRVDRFTMARASTPAERRWAARLHDELSGSYVEALSAPGSRQALAAVDERKRISRKTDRRSP